MERWDIRDLAGHQHQERKHIRRLAEPHIMSRIGIGIAPESGVARGWAHLAVLRAVDRLGLVPDVIAGKPLDVSINSRVGYIGLLDFHRANELIEFGEAAVERAMTEIRDAISVFSSIPG